MSRDFDIHEFLVAEGFAQADAEAAALDVLYSSGLTRPGKQRLSEPKLEPARQALAGALVLTCTAAACLEEARGMTEKQRVPANDRRGCEICEGSDNQHAVDAFVKRALEKKMTRLVVLGGSPSTREQLAAALKGRIELKAVDGTLRRTQAQAYDDMKWAHLVLIWGSTELAHRVSILYTRAPGQIAPVITCPRRGIGALAAAALRAIS